MRPTENRIVSDVLKASLIRRQSLNRRYSIRAFARDLGVSPAFLSLVLNGKRNLSIETVVKIGERLGLSSIEKAKFLRKVLPFKAQRSFAALQKIDDDEIHKTFHDLDIDHFRLISDWYHLVILDFTTCTNFRNDPEWIAYKIGIPTTLVEEALGRLRRMGLIRQHGSRLIKTKNRLFIKSGLSKESIREHHRQMIQKALDELLKISDADFARRSISSITIAINPKRLNGAFKKIASFQKSLANYLSDGDCSEVFQFNQQLIPLTKKEVNA